MNTNDTSRIRSILYKNPNTWSPEEVQAICQSFIKACNNERYPPNRLLTTRLWRYWFLVHDEKPLMDNPKYNIALMLHAQSFGDCVPLPSNNNFFGSYLQQHQQFQASLTPPLLTWGPRACINTFSGPTLDSLIVHVFIFRQNNQQISEILIIGKGIPEIQQDVFQATFSCVLQNKVSDLDMINGDVYRILASDNNQELFDIPGITTSNIAPVPSQSSTSDGLNELVRKLRLFQRQTELVAVHDNCDASIKESLDTKLRRYAKEANLDKSSAIIVAKDPDRSPEMTGLATLLPYYHIARRPLPLQITLDPDILDIPSFHELLEAFTYQSVERICLDAEVRLQTYEKQRSKLTEEKKRWDEADEYTRKMLWDEYVLLNEKLDFEAGITIRLSKPERCLTAVYMKNNVPSLINQYEQWANRMHKVIEDIREIKQRPDKPILRLAASRFLDAALRQYHNSLGDETLNICFQQWSTQVSPLLRWRWQTILEEKGIDTEMVFRRNTVFHTRFQIDENYNIISLVMQPFAMVSPIHSAVIFDSENPILGIKEPSDYVEEYSPSNNTDINVLWEDLQQSFRHLDKTSFIKKIREALEENPAELSTKIIDYLTSHSSINLEKNQIDNSKNNIVYSAQSSSHQSFFQRLIRLLNTEITFSSVTAPFKKSDNSNVKAQEDFLSQESEIIEKMRLAALPTIIVTLLNQGAFHSVRQLLKEIHAPADLEVYLTLWELLIECLANKQPLITIPNLQSKLVSTTEEWVVEIKEKLHNAEKLNKEIVIQWIKLIENASNEQQAINSAINFLQRQWIRFENVFSTPEQQLLYSAQSAISLTELARKLEKKAKNINSYSESTTTLLTKIDNILEELLLSEAPGVPHAEILSLLEKLLGEEMS